MASDSVSRARALGGAAEAVELYRTWAATYDDDVFVRGGFTGTARIAELLVAHLDDRDRPVLDLGCGTGAAGVRLAELGITAIDGVDLSPEMLRVAADKGVYRRLVVADLTRPVLPLASGYGALVSAGTFTTGHVGADAVPALVRLTEPGGLIAWVIAAALWPAFAPVLDGLRVRRIHESLEPIRIDGPPESVMFVGRTPGPAEP